MEPSPSQPNAGTCPEVTAQREGELRTEESLLFRREAEKIARIGAWKVSPRTDYLYWTEGVYEILELPLDYRPGLEEGMRFYDAESVPVLREALTRALRDGTSFVLETGLTTRTGRHIWTEVRGLGRIEEGGQAFVMGTFQDVTARKEALHALRESEQRLRLALLAGRQGLVDLDIPSGRILVNDEYARMLGHDPRRFLETHETWLARLHPDDVEPCRAAFRGYLAGTLPEYRVEFRQRTASGHWKWILSTGLIVSRDSAGNPIRMLGTHLDIDERKQAEERTRLLRDLGLHLAGVPDVATALRITLAAALDIGGVEAGGIYLVDETTGGLRLACHVGISRRFVTAVSDIPADSPNVRWAQEHRPYHGNANLVDLPQIGAVRREGLRAFSMVPIVEEGRLLAVLNLASRTHDELPVPVRTTLESVAQVLGTVLARLHAQEALRRANAELERRVTERTRELARSETKFRTLFETSRDAIVTAGPTGALLDGNRAALALFGFGDKTELLAQTLETLSPTRQADSQLSAHALLDIQEQVLRQGSAFYEWTHRRRDGSVFPAEVSLSVAMIDGQPVLRGLIRDISGRRAADNQLRASEARFRRLLEAAPLPMGTMNQEGQITFLNHRFLQLFGYPRDALQTIEDWMLLAYPDETYRQQALTRWQGAVAKATAENQDIEPLEYRVSCADGRTRDVIISGVRLGSDLLATFLDVTRLREADADLRKLRSAVEQSPSVVVITDTRGRIEYVNPAFETQTGYRAAEVVGGNPRMLKSGVHPPAFFANLWQTLSERRIWRGELCNRRKNGSLFWESTAIAPVSDAAGNVTHFVAIKEDITERRRVAEELHRAKEAAESASRAKSRFLANMSHEIRTPMNVILGFAQLMQRDPSLEARHRQYLDTINRSGEHLLRLLNDVLDMSRIEADRLPLVPSDFDFHALLDEVTAIFRLRTEDTGLDFAMTCAPDVPGHLHTDAGRVRQVLLNLLGNAAKFTRRGRIDLRVSLASTPPSTASRPAPVVIAVEVSDTGPGIPSDELELIFQPFEQSKAGHDLGGTGLGLSISRQIALLLGGELTVSSQLGMGSTFRFVFQAIAWRPPSEARSPVTESPTRLQLAPGMHGPLILLVDDVPLNRDLLRLPLEEAGFRIAEATDGEAAVQLAASLQPDLILMDLRMPVMDGLAATSLIRRGPPGRRVRIIIVTAGVFEVTEADCLAAGADGFLTTPVVHAELFARIGQLLGLTFSATAPVVAGEPTSPSTPPPPLPHVLRDRIIAATELGDFLQLRRLIRDEVVPLDPALAQSLGQWVSSFDYPALLNHLRKPDSPAHE